MQRVVITMLNRSEKHEAVVGKPVKAEEVNSKRYYISKEKPTDDLGKIGDVCFVFDVV